MNTGIDKVENGLKPEPHRIINDRRGPFYPGNEDAYQAWRTAKLDAYPSHIDDLIVPISVPTNPSDEERAAILQRCRKANMAIYRCAGAANSPAEASATAQCFGLSRVEDHRSAGDHGLVSVEVAP